MYGRNLEYLVNDGGGVVEVDYDVGSTNKILQFVSAEISPKTIRSKVRVPAAGECGAPRNSTGSPHNARDFVAFWFFLWFYLRAMADASAKIQNWIRTL